MCDCDSDQLNLFPSCDLPPQSTRWTATHPRFEPNLTGVVGLRHRPAVLRSVSLALLEAAVRDAIPRGIWSVRLWRCGQWECDCARLRVLPATPRKLPWRVWCPGVGVIGVDGRAVARCVLNDAPTAK